MKFRFILCLLFASLWGTKANAQDDSVSSEEDPFESGVFEVQGKIQVPKINIPILKKNLDKAYELKLRESFIPKIKESMKKKPF